MIVTSAGIPECAAGFVDGRHAFVQLTARAHEDWAEDVLFVLSGRAGEERVGRDVQGLFGDLTPDELRTSVLPVSRAGAEDLVRLLAVGSFFRGPDPALREVNEERDACVRRILDEVGDGCEFFTNHGHAEDGEVADFLSSGFHWNSLANVLYDVGLIGVSAERVLVMWRLEDA